MNDEEAEKLYSLDKERVILRKVLSVDDDGAQIKTAEIHLFNSEDQFVKDWQQFTKTPKQIFIQDVENRIEVKHDIVVDVKYQDITYYMHDRDRTIKGKSIDFLDATTELLLLDWTYSPNYLGFTNHNTNENIQFCCVGPDRWYAEILIKNNGKWEGYVWCCYSKFEPIEDTLKLFFEKVPWSGILPWKLKRIGRYAND